MSLYDTSVTAYLQTLGGVANVLAKGEQHDGCFLGSGKICHFLCLLGEPGLEQVHCLVENGGILRDRKGLNLQGGGLSIAGLAKHDEPHIELAARMGADFLAVSFVSSAEDMHRARELLHRAGSEAALVAKIERLLET